MDCIYVIGNPVQFIIQHDLIEDVIISANFCQLPDTGMLLSGILLKCSLEGKKMIVMMMIS